MYAFAANIVKQMEEEDAASKIQAALKSIAENNDMSIIDLFANKNQEVFKQSLGEVFRPHEDDEQLEEDDDDPEMEDYDMDFEEEEEEVKSSYFGNYSALGFVAKSVKCNLDDLMELLTNSSKYQAALEQIEQSGALYVDPEFPADQNSLCGYSMDFNERNKMNSLSFKRSEEYFGEDAIVYDTIGLGDIMQGNLGDCYFLAAISAIAEHPERLKRLFLTKENEKNGLFAVALCLNGVWEEVILDDMAPCNSNGQLAFNSSENHELWVVLLEKAWAKVHGGYLNIEGGLTQEALRDLTGASTKTYFTNKNPDALWVRLMEAERLDFVMTAGSDDLSGGSDVYVPKIGISGSHAYSLLAVFQLNDNGNGLERVGEGDDYSHRLVKLRNPWGQGEWKGAWSDKDQNWTEGLKESTGFTGEIEDGIFFMTWEDFLTYYSDVQICYYHDGYKYSAQKYESKRNETVFVKFTIHTPGTYYFSLNQRNRRFYSEHLGYQYTHISWVLGKSDGEDSKFMGSEIRADKESWAKIECDAGEYYVMMHTPWRSISREFSYSVYGPGLTNLVKVSEDELPEGFINQIFISKAKEELETKGADLAHQKFPGIKYVSSEHNGWAFVYFENNEEEHQISVTLDLGGSQSGVRVLPPYFGFKPTMVVAPGESEIVLYKNNGRRTISLTMTTSFLKMDRVDSIKSLVKESKTILRKQFNGDEVEVRVHFYYHKLGMALLFVNETDDLTLNEDLEFSLDNAHIEGINGNRMHISLGPGKERLIKVVRDSEAEFQVRLARIMYTITQKSSLYSNNKWW